MITRLRLDAIVNSEHRLKRDHTHLKTRNHTPIAKLSVLTDYNRFYQTLHGFK